VTVTNGRGSLMVKTIQNRMLYNFAIWSL